jgi:LPS O-antigen subunit length determinant protein (WzzB/FepE family)
VWYSTAHSSVLFAREKVRKMSETSRSATENEMSLVDLWRAIWAGRWFIVVVSAGFTLVGVAYAFLAQEWYRSVVVLAPVGQKSVAGGLSSLGGIAALAGIRLPADDEQHPIAVLKSKDFARDFIEELGLISEMPWKSSILMCGA